MTGVLIMRRNLDTDTHTGRMSYEDKGRDGSDASASQGMSKMASKTPEPRIEAWNRFSLTALTKIQSSQHLDLGLLASRTVRQ